MGDFVSGRRNEIPANLKREGMQELGNIGQEVVGNIIGQMGRGKKRKAKPKRLKSAKKAKVTKKNKKVKKTKRRKKRINKSPGHHTRDIFD